LTRHFPWGTESLLEESERHRACRMALDPGAEGSFVPPTGVEVHLIGIAGAGAVESGPLRRRLAAGESLRLPGGGEVIARADKGGCWELMRVDVRSG
jgi:mannose-6-phosphate isomerase-like protein (cupin superfamily)